MSRWVERLWYPDRPESAGARAVRAPLAFLAGGFRAGVAARNALYDRGVLAVERVQGMRVISVGNLVSGGAGKTPVVAFLAERLVGAGARVAVLTRGHGRLERGVVQVVGPPWPPVEAVGDEPLLLAQRLPRVSVWVGADRVELARRARDGGATVALLDDGFQHRRLARDVDLVVLDGAVGWGNGHLIPWGPLREPLSSLGRASVVWMRVAERPVVLPALPGGVAVVSARHAAADLREPGGAVGPLSRLAGRRVIGFCGIARPSSFERTLRGLGAEVTELRDFPDHHAFRPSELAALRAAAEAAQAELVTTEKDAVRLPASFGVWVVRLGVEVVEGEREVERLVAG